MRYFWRLSTLIDDIQLLTLSDRLVQNFCSSRIPTRRQLSFNDQFTRICMLFSLVLLCVYVCALCSFDIELIDILAAVYITSIVYHT